MSESKQLLSFVSVHLRDHMQPDTHRCLGCAPIHFHITFGIRIEVKHSLVYAVEITWALGAECRRVGTVSCGCNREPMQPDTHRCIECAPIRFNNSFGLAIYVKHSLVHAVEMT